MTHPDVFLAVQRQMVAELADDDVGHQPGASDAPGQGPFRRWRTGHAVLAVPTSVLRPHMLVDLQLGGNVFQHSGHVFADAVLDAPAMAALLFRRQVVFVTMVRQTGQIEFALLTATTRMGRDLLPGFRGRDGEGRFRLGRRRPFKQMSLTGAFGDALPATTVDPTLVPRQFLQRRGVLVPQFLERGRRFVQHPAEFRDLVLRLGGALRGVG